jgi:hypothetical protein
LNADALEAERLRKECILNLPETNPEEIRLNGYCELVKDKPDTHQYTEQDWQQLVRITTPTVQEMLQYQGIEPLAGDEFEKVIRYMIANGIYLGDAESYVRAFKALRNHGVLRQPLPVAEVVETPTPGRFDSVSAEIESLKAHVLTFTFGSRERENLEREIYRKELMLETVGNSRHADILQELVETSGLVLSGDNNLKFQIWLDAPKQVRRFDASRTSVRLAFCEYFGCPQLLSENEQSLVANYHAIESMTAEDVKNQVGSRNTYSPHNDAYRANPTGN